MATSNDSSQLPAYLQDENLTEECKELIRTLPTSNGRDWLWTLHLYQGFWFTARHLNGVLLARRHFRAADSDILLVAGPKTGTTWLKAVLFALQKRSCYSEPDRKSNHPLLQKNPHELIPYLEFTLYLKDQDPDLSGLTSPRMFATHMPLGSLP
ncbi:hypothetical protein CRG98_044188, partial [Punica granatum]